MDGLVLVLRKRYSKRFVELLYYIIVNSKDTVTPREESKDMTECELNSITAMRTTRAETAIKNQKDDMLS